VSPGVTVDEVGDQQEDEPTRTAPAVVAVAACAACCAPPILGAIGITVGLSGLAWLAGGLVVAGIVALLGPALLVRHRRRGTA